MSKVIINKNGIPREIDLYSFQEVAIELGNGDELDTIKSLIKRNENDETRKIIGFEKVVSKLSGTYFVQIYDYEVV